MAYQSNTASILSAAGYVPLVDFEAESSGGDLTITWLHTDPQPTEAQVASWGDDSQALPSGKTFTQSKEPAHVEINGIKMATDLQSQAAFSNMMTLLNEAGMADGDMVAIKDCFSVSHPLTVSQFRANAVSYGLFCYNEFHAE